MPIVEPLIVQSELSQAFPTRTQGHNQKQFRTAWMGSRLLGWNNVTLGPGVGGNNAEFRFSGAQHVAVMVTQALGIGILQFEFQEYQYDRGLFIMRDTIAPSFVGLWVFGKNGDSLGLTGLQASHFNVIPQETGGTDPVTFTADLYVTSH